VAGEPEELPVFGLEQFGGAPMVPPGLPERKSASTVALMAVSKLTRTSLT
jgi:hypothetical protein